MQVLRGEALAAWLAAQLASEWRPVVGPLEPRNTLVHHGPTWCVVAGPEGARHVVAVVGEWRVELQSPWRLEAPVDFHVAKPEDQARAGARLGEVAARWFETARERPGVADVAFRVWFELASRFVHEQWRLTIGAESASIALMREAIWPVYVHVVRSEGGIELAVGQMRSADPEPLVPELERMIRQGDAWMSRLRRAREVALALARDARAPAGAWQVQAPDVPSFRWAPLVWVRAVAADESAEVAVLEGFDDRVEVRVLRERRVVTAATGAEDARWFERATARVLNVACLATLRPGRRYRVVRELDGAPIGSVLEFERVTEVKPSGEDVWFFHRVDEREPGRSVAFGANDTAAMEILERLDEYLVPLT